MVSESQSLECERKALEKHESWAGEIVKVPAVSFEHGQLTLALLTECALQLRESRLVVMVSKMRVYAREARAFLYPDVVVVQDPPDFFDVSKDTITDPRAVLEVVSPATLEHDRGRKLRAYQGIPSVKHCVLVREDEVWLEHHQRRDEGWEARELGRGELLAMGEWVGVEIEVEAIYRRELQSTRLAAKARAE